MAPLFPQKNGLGKHCDERLAQKENSMKSKIAPGTSERLPRQILLFSLPLMASNVLQVLFNMADIAVIGRFAGSLSMAAVGSTATAVTLFTGILIGVGGGINALVARYYGARDRQELQRTVHSSAIICLICGILLLIFGFFGSRPLLRLLNTKPELLDKATLYMQIYFCGMPALALYNFGNAVYSAIGNTKKPLYYLLFSGIVNVVLNLVFVIVCDLDVAGVALASIISQYLSAIFLTAALFRNREAYGLSPKLLRLHRKNCREILTLGIPAGLQNAIFYIANMFIQAGVNSFDTVYGGRQFRRRQCRRSGLRRDGGLLHRVQQLHRHELRGGAAQGDPAQLPDLPGVFLRRGRHSGLLSGGLRPRVPDAVHHRRRRHRGGHEAADHHGLLLLRLRLHGQRHRRLPGAGKESCAHDHRHFRLLHFPDHLGSDRVRMVQDHSVAVSRLHFLLVDHRRL